MLTQHRHSRIKRGIHDNNGEITRWNHHADYKLAIWLVCWEGIGEGGVGSLPDGEFAGM
jgi:hypothetical protein